MKLDFQNPDKRKHKRIYLRSLEKADVTDKYVAWLNDSDVNRYLPIRHAAPLSIDDVIDFVEECKLQKRPHWGIFHKDQHIGNVSCSMHNLRNRLIDISFLIGEKALWGKGICTNAVANILDYLFADQSFHRVQGGVCSANRSSIRIFQKLGFTQEACFREAVLLEGEYADDLKFGMLADEWLSCNYEYIKYKVYPLGWSFF